MQQNPYASPQAALHQGHGGAVSLVTPRVVVATSRCRPWLFVLSVACFIVFALSLVGMLMADGDYSEKGVWIESPVDVGSLVTGGIAGLIQILCGIFFWKFGNSLGQFGTSRNEADLVSALRSELNVIRVVGITALVYVILVVVVVAGSLALARGGTALPSLEETDTSGEAADPESDDAPANDADAEPE